MQLQQKNLILVGHKGAGKTYFGKMLSEECGIPLIDTDALIEKRFQGLSCREISLKIGEDNFRLIEQEVIESLECVNTIISVGGGALLKEGNCTKLRKLGKLLYLEADQEIVRKRMFNTGIPSFLDPLNLEASFEKMYEERKSIYEKWSHFKIQITNKPQEEILRELQNHLQLNDFVRREE